MRVEEGRLICDDAAWARMLPGDDHNFERMKSLNAASVASFRR